MNTSKQWVPEIYYEEDSDGLTSHIPFISVPTGEKMPNILFMFGSTETGEEEIGSEGEPLPIVDLDLHQYANMNTLRDNLSTEMYNTVRVCLGLESLAEATIKGRKLTDNIRSNIEEN